MRNSEIQTRLGLVATVYTPKQGVPNEVVHVGADSVELRSHRTGRSRTVTYDQLRNAASETRNGVIVRTLATILGLYSP